MAKPFIRRHGKHGARKFQKKTQTDREAKRQKWLHHCLKTLQKELKKAKEFEIRKLLRRIRDAKEGADKQTGTGKHQQQLDVSKLTAQLEAAKALQLEPLAKQVAESAGLLQPVDAHAEEQPPGSTIDTQSITDELQNGPQQPLQQQQQDVSSPQGMLARRVSTAGCVRKQTEAFQQQYRKLFGQKQKQKQRNAGSTQADALQEKGQEAASNGQGEAEEGRLRSRPGTDEEPGGSNSEADELEPRAGKQHMPRFVHPLLAAGSSDDGEDDMAGQGSGDMEPNSGDISADEDADGDGRRDDMGEAVGSEEEAFGQEGGEEGSEDEGSFNSEDYDMDIRQSDDSDSEQQQQQAATSKASVRASTDLQAIKPIAKPQQQPQVEAKSKGDKAGAKAEVSKKLLKAAARKDKQDMLRNDPLLQPRKNRVGQRARRALYEKMYGTRANHLSKQTQPVRRRGDSEPADRFNRSQHDRKRAGSQAVVADQPGKKARPSSTASAQQQDQAAEEKLHPSWAARKAAKQKLAISAAAPMQPAKKVVFDDAGEVAKVIVTGIPQQQQQQQSAVHAVVGGSSKRGGQGRGRGGSETAGQPGRAGGGSRQGDGYECGGGSGRGGPVGGRGRFVGGSGGKRGGFAASSRSPVAVGRDHREHAQRGDASKAADPHLHPSWVAKQQMKQKQQALVPAEGKKIVFDD